MVHPESRSAVLKDLTRRLRSLERSRPADFQPRAVVPCGIPALDDLLHDRGLRHGSIVEWLADAAGSGAMTLALMAARNILPKGRLLVVLDPLRQFHPVAAAALGIDPGRVVVVRPPVVSALTIDPDQVQPRWNSWSGPSQLSLVDRNTTGTGRSRMARARNDFLWTLEQVLRSPAVGATVCSVEHLNDHVFRRLALAAQAGDGICFLRRPITVRRQATWADVRFLVQPRPSIQDDGVRRIRVQLLRCRNGLDGGAVELAICEQTSAVRLVSQLADPTSAQRAIGA